MQSESPSSIEAPPARQLAVPLGQWLRGPRGLVLTASLATGAGLVLGWDWLVAAGAAPILIAVLPCALMCGLGLCMMPKKGASRDKRSPVNEAADQATPASRPASRE